MTNRLFVSAEKDPDRLANLTGLQSRMLSHAMRAFTKAKKIVYSTCSIHPEENEKVVQECLEMCPDWKLIKPIEFAEKWKHFGSPKFKHIGKKCIYAKSEIDLTDGFFVAIFEREIDPSKPIEPYSRNEAVLERINFNLKPKFNTETTADIDNKKSIGEETIDLTIDHVNGNSTENGSKKKKKRKHNDSVPEDNVEKVEEPVQEITDPEVNSTKKSKKKRKCSDFEDKGGANEPENQENDVEKSKKGKRKATDKECESSTLALDESASFDGEKVKKKKKKKHDNNTCGSDTALDEKIDTQSGDVTDIAATDADSIKKKKKKSKK